MYIQMLVVIMKGQTYIQLLIDSLIPFIIYRLPEVKDEKKSRRHSIIGIGFDIPKLVILCALFNELRNQKISN